MKKIEQTIYEKDQEQKYKEIITSEQRKNFRNKQETIKSVDKNLQKLDSLANESQHTLLKIKAVFPFNFFPDEIIIDETKVSIIRKLFFFSNQIRSVAHEDILNVIVEYHIFFATLGIVDRSFIQQPISINYLKKNDAILARCIIQGIIIAKKEGVDFNMVTVKDLVQKAKRIGEV